MFIEVLYQEKDIRLFRYMTNSSVSEVKNTITKKYNVFGFETLILRNVYDDSIIKMSTFIPEEKLFSLIMSGSVIKMHDSYFFNNKSEEDE